MRLLLRRLWIPIYSFWLLRYVRKERVYEHAGLQLTVPAGVFHPGVFFSTPVFISFLQEIDFQGKSVLDVGTGSGLLALFAARQGALVTALDINPSAVEAARRNAVANGLTVTVVESDLFAGLPAQTFNIILINPPYYAAPPRDIPARAFFAGANWEYFEQLFRQMPAYLHPSWSDDSKSSDQYLVKERPDDFESSDRVSSVWMILSENCNLGKIKDIAAANGLRLTSVFEKKKWGERFFVIKIESVQGK